MPYIIDGDNLIGSSPDIALEDPEARSKLVHIIRTFQENRNNKVTVVFDGEPVHGVHREDFGSKFSVRYPVNGSSADDEIKEILGSFNHFKDVVLVTSDRELKTFARKKGARTINSIEFYFELKRISHISGKVEESRKRIDAQLSDREVDLWMKIFED
jgi:predicted RNA-binding protein with PIN domain